MRRLLLSVLYIFLIAGALWHHLGWFVATRRVLSSPLLIVLAFSVAALMYPRQDRKGAFVLWSVAIVILGYSLEWFGVHTGWPFGIYDYHQAINLHLSGVPLGIAFGWLGNLIMALALTRWIFSRAGGGLPLSRNFLQIVTASLLGAVIMTGFDGLLEPAAMALGYWSWAGSVPPALNFLAWFGFSFLFALPAVALGLFDQAAPPGLYHVCLAQNIFFVLINLNYFV